MVYVFGGHIDAGTPFPVQAYDLETDTWTAKSTEIYESAGNGVGTIGRLMYLSGGFQISGEAVYSPSFFYAYDPEQDVLTRKASMPKATSEGVTGVIHNKLYVLPGFCSGQFWPSPAYCEIEAIKDLFRYDPATDSWETLAPAPHFHRKGAGGVIHGKFYVAGGAQVTGQPVADLDAYDPKTNAWTTLAPMPAAGVAVGGVLRDKLVVVVGSEFPGLPGQSSERQTFSYDPRSNTWETEASYPTPLKPGAAARATLHGRDYLLTVGGRHDADVPNDSQLYTP